MSQYIFFQAADIFDWSGGGGFFGMIQEQYGPEDQSVSGNEKKINKNYGGKKRN